jgi:hypothetical protein
MKCACNTDWCYALVRDEKVRRLTFSRDLAEYIQKKNPDHKIVLLDLVVGEYAHHDDICLFGIMSHKNKLLRVAVSWEEAEYLTQDSSRSIVKCLVRKVREHAAPLLHSS